MPLLIGGATTSKQHTAVKIAPEYSGPVVHVLDASRAVDVVSSLLGDERADVRRREPRDAGRDPASSYATQAAEAAADLRAGASPTACSIDWDDHAIASPWFIGRRYLDDVPLADIAPFIDWTFFFSAWELKGRFPAILDHPDYGSAARELYDNAQALLEADHRRAAADGARRLRLLAGQHRRRRHRASTRTTRRREELARLPMLRQQEVIADGQPNRSLADFIAPRDSRRAGLHRHVRGHGRHRRRRAGRRQFERDHDDYNAIMVKALADRLAEAFAEYLHAQARKDWGYGESERLTPEDLVAEKYRGIRPAFGYPACPDHTEKGKLFELLDAGRQGLTLTDSFAMLPAASVSGLYFSHPEAKYFNVGRIGRDQLESYARRKGMPFEDAERWLAPNLAYDPAEVALKG